MLDILNFYVVPGLVVGCVYALGAVGISLVFGILRFAHFAHGDLMALGAYLALPLVAALGLPIYVALLLAILPAIAAALLVDRLFYRPLRRGRTVTVAIASFGVALILRAAIQLGWGPDSHVYQSGIVPPLVLGGFRIAERHIYIIAAAVIAVVLLHLFLTRTKIGKAMRAMSDDAELARVSGIRTEGIVAWTWCIAAALAALAGGFVGLDSQLQPQMGFTLLLPMFAAAVLGGIGRPYGAILGGLVIGLAEELSTLPLLDGAPLLEPSYKSAVAFVILVAMLLWRPTGLLKGRVL